jgi:hypothetical protein
MAKPIFILGHHRSGTTWLANQLAAHPEVAAVEHPAHAGVHESVFFSHVHGRFGDIAEKNNFVQFVEVFGAGDYAALARASRDFLYSLYPASYEEVFRAVMDRLARRCGCACWLEKSPAHTPLAPWIARMFPDAQFVGIIRDPRPVAASALKKRPDPAAPFGLGRLSHVLKLAWSYTYYNRVLRSFLDQNESGFCIHYSDLKADFERQMMRVERKLGLDHHEAVLRTQYPPNTSFNRPRERRALRRSEEATFRLFRRCMQCLPLPALRGIGRLRKLTRGQRPLPPWFYRLHRRNVGLDRSD